MDAFEDELSAFIQRVKVRAKVRIEDAAREAEAVGVALWVWLVCHMIVYVGSQTRATGTWWIGPG